MNCPRDHHELTDRIIDDLPIQKCLDCFGLWIPKDVIISLANAENFPALVQLMESEKFPISALPLGTLTCPLDGTLMHTNSIHNVEVDICPSCRGFWLDRGELDEATFRERHGWSEHKVPEDNFLQLFIDTVAYTPEWATNPARRLRIIDLLKVLLKILFFQE